jgi:enoyl-CoA hydratase/carnithine racemase
MSFKLLNVSKPAAATWQITLHAPPDNRLTNDMLAEIASALDQIELEWRKTSKHVLGAFTTRWF